MQLPVPGDPDSRPRTAHATYRNRILAALPAEELELIRPYLFRVSLVASQILYEKGVPRDAVYFLEQGLVTLVADVGHEETVQVAMTGFEGVLGTAVMIRPDLVSEYQNVVEVAGSAYRMQVADFLRLVEQAATLKDLCLRTMIAFGQQIAQTSACNARHDLPRRLCRLLLMVDDRSGGGDVVLTQAQTARMIGVRRAGVSTVMATLQDGALLRQARGRIMLLDRPGIRALACDCYARMELK